MSPIEQGIITVLHITPHLGGGVGRALSCLITQTRWSDCRMRHVVACLEQPEKNYFLDQIRAGGGEVVIAPSRSDIDKLVFTADLVQVEWWNHPATIACLCRMAVQPIRLLVWCHVSGLYNPIIPPKLMEIANKFLFTSPCSFEASQVSALAPRLGSKLAVVSSGGGFDGLPEPEPDGNKLGPLSVGYLGSFNFAKLHPNYVNFLSAVNLPDFKIRMIGDLLNQDILDQQCIDAGRPRMLNFRGYTEDIVSELQAINVLAYLLNPQHYGTAENALLEAMAMGITPVVLDNPCERNIVEHLRTGLIVRSPDEFADAIKWLAHHPEERSRIGVQAAATVRARFSSEKMGASFCNHYQEILSEQKQLARFEEVFGVAPDQWFLSCQESPEQFDRNGKIHAISEKSNLVNLLEKTKGSIFHFHRFFPENARLASWAGHVRKLSGDGNGL